MLELLKICVELPIPIPASKQDKYWEPTYPGLTIYTIMTDVSFRFQCKQYEPPEKKKFISFLA